ncbi:hypothetical protein ACFYRY_36780 [Streptomyces sp. NPDC005263]|uniref:hypothetical protein n=1 Tax=Streptomyces sp. NPDC005263 TaxID=3364711 RepID=UPI0036CDA498
MNCRLLALAGVAVCAVALPLAVASAGQVGDERRPSARGAVRPSAPTDARGAVGPSASTDARGAVLPSASAGTRDALRPSARADAEIRSAEPTGSPRLLGLGLATAARCGPELTSPDGVEAQTCVLTQGEENWARTYYRNVTGESLNVMLSMMGPGGRTVQMRCAVAAEDDPGMCETPRERGRSDVDAYTAVAEFAQSATKGGRGPLLLRSGSNSGTSTGS